MGLSISLAYPSGEEGVYFIRTNDFYLPSLCLEGGRGSAPKVESLKSTFFVKNTFVLGVKLFLIYEYFTSENLLKI
jgi:hypothetical protein